MAADTALIEWAKESLEPLGTITHRAMMGAAVLYCDGTVFALVDDEAIYFKMDAVSAPMWGGYTVIERAHLDWTDVSWLKVRVGNFFTPFGIWNVDHGTPTLISVQLPGLIQTRVMPIRQTGIQIYGNTFSGDWELGYMATVSNGRREAPEPARVSGCICASPAAQT